MMANVCLGGICKSGAPLQHSNEIPQEIDKYSKIREEGWSGFGA
jgi:hypothetical protein